MTLKVKRLVENQEIKDLFLYNSHLLEILQLLILSVDYRRCKNKYPQAIYSPVPCDACEFAAKSV